jgi:hypothetical protein
MVALSNECPDVCVELVTGLLGGSTALIIVLRGGITILRDQAAFNAS